METWLLFNMQDTSYHSYVKFVYIITCFYVKSDELHTCEEVLSRNIVCKGVGRKISKEWGGNEKKTENSTIKFSSALSVWCMKIQGGHVPLAPRCWCPWLFGR